MLAACGGGGATNPASPEPAPAPAPASADLTQPRLLSDAELQVSPKASEWQPSAAVQQWLQARHAKMRSLTHDADFSDLSALKGWIGNRRIAMLGESSHGSREFNQAKVRLIKFMHQEMGFSVLAVESSALGCALQDRKFAAKSPFAVGESCLFPVWATHEVDELLRYIASTHDTARPLRLVGFDVQQSSAFERAEDVALWLASVLDATGDPNLSDSSVRIVRAVDLTQTGRQCGVDGRASACVVFDANRAATSADLLALESGAMAAAYQPGVSEALKRERILAGLGLANIRDRLSSAQVARGTSRANFRDRDPFMAATLTRYAREAFPNERIVVWAHNAHIAQNTTGFPDSGPPMGSVLKESWGDDLFSMGLFMLRGASADSQSRQAIAVRSLPAASLEAHAAFLGLGAVFLPVPQTNEPDAGDDWWHQPLHHWYWGYAARNEVLAKDFNAVLMIDTSRVPRYR